MPRLKKHKILLSAVAVAAALGAAGYVRHDLLAGSADTQVAAAPAAIPVDIVTVERHPVRLWREFSARLEAVDEVELRPQVSGRIVEVRFRDGQAVAQGDVLFVIEPGPFESAVAQARADLAGAKERREFAERELARARKLVRTKAVAERVLDQRENEFATAKSEVEAAAARLEQAEIDLDHAYVKAPISGRVSRVEITLGNLVQAGPDAPLLTTIVSNKGIYADFEVDENTYLQFVHSAARDMDSERSIPVRLSIGTDDPAVVEGEIYSFDNRIDPRTGTIRARALFANADGSLLPGMFARVKMGSALEREAVLLTERAILTDQDRKYVYVVNGDRKAAYREVTLGPGIAGRRVIEKGLQAGDQVIVGGMMVVRPNAVVAPRKADAQQAGAGGRASVGG